MSLCFAFSSPAWAQESSRPAPTDPRRDEEARSLFDAGRFAFEDGRFEEALTLFRRAYDLSHRSALLYNIGSAAERLLRHQDAIDAFAQFIEENPDVPNRGEVQRRIDIQREALQREAGQDPIADTPPATTEPPAPVSEPAPPAQHGSSFPVGTVIAGSAAVVFGALSLVFWSSANGSYDDLEADCGRTRSCTDADVDDSGAKSAVTLTNVFLIGSLAAVAAAGVLAVIELGGSDEGDTQVAIGVDHIELRGTF